MTILSAMNIHASDRGAEGVGVMVLIVFFFFPVIL